MTQRIMTTEAVLWRIGGDKPISREKLRQLRMDYPELLKPVFRGRYSAEKVDKLIDILTGVKSHSSSEPDYMAIFRENLHGERKSGISH